MTEELHLFIFCTGFGLRRGGDVCLFVVVVFFWGGGDIVYLFLTLFYQMFVCLFFFQFPSLSALPPSF